MSKLLKKLKEKILICDGAMGSMIQEYDLSVKKDFLGHDNCSEILLKTRPDIITSIHEAYLKAGADIIETNTFGANPVVLKEFGLEDDTYEFNLLGAKIARGAVENFQGNPLNPPYQGERFVAGGIGPGTKLASLGQITFNELYDGYKLSAKGLIDGKVDCILIETCQDLLQIKAAVIAVKDALQELNKDLPIFVQVTIEQTGTMLVGSKIEAVCAVLAPMEITGLGLNCGAGPYEMEQYIKILSQDWPFLISMQPNAGLPEVENNKTVYNLKPDEFADKISDIISKYRVNIIGGCCGTTPEYIRKVSDRLHGKRETPLAPLIRGGGKFASLYDAVSVKQELSIFMVGERLNATGSRAFKEKLINKDIDAISKIAKDQIKNGANMLDVSVSMVGGNEKEDMEFIVKRLVKDSTVPLMIDSYNVDVMEHILPFIPGRPVINSINLENGEEKLGRICRLCKKFGAGVVALTIDEDGMARTADKKAVIADRLIELACNKYGINKNSIFLDLLTFTIATGNPEDRNLAAETLKAIEIISRKHPECHIISGVSNVSFGLKGETRKVLTSVFLHEAIKKGLTSGIVHVGNILSLHKIEKEKLEKALDLIYNKNEHALQDYIKLFNEKNSKIVDDADKKEKNIEESLIDIIVDGDSSIREEILNKALTQYKPLEIINNFLLKGMKKVGELFVSGEMQLPFVLQSAEVMKASVDYLGKFLDKKDKDNKKSKSIVLATVAGDVHDIGKNLVDIIFTSNGFKVYNIGVKQNEKNILDAVKKYSPDAIGLSGLLVKSTLIMGENLEFFKDNNIKIPVLLGGAALNRKYVENDLAKKYNGSVHYCKDVFSGLEQMQNQ